MTVTLKHRLMVIVIFFLVLSGCKGLESRDIIEVKWHTLEEGIETAMKQNKPCVVDFFAGQGCPRCEKLEKYVYSNPVIARRLNTEFVPIRIDLTKPLTPEEKALGEKYDYKNECLLLFLTPDGQIVKDPMGKKLCFVDYIPPDWFLKYLDLAKERAMKQGGRK